MREGGAALVLEVVDDGAVDDGAGGVGQGGLEEKVSPTFSPVKERTRSVASSAVRVGGLGEEEMLVLNREREKLGFERKDRFVFV